MNATRFLVLLALALGAAAGGLLAYVMNAMPPPPYGGSAFLWELEARHAYARVEGYLVVAIVLGCVAGVCLLGATGLWWRDRDHRGPRRDRWQRAADRTRDW